MFLKIKTVVSILNSKISAFIPFLISNFQRHNLIKMSTCYIVSLNSCIVCSENTKWRLVFLLTVVDFIKFNKTQIIVIFNLKINLI